MMEKLNEALEELKRVDHLIYVSLKYTRTVDVIINILGRMVDAYSLMVDALVEYGMEKGKILNEPESAVERAMLIERIFKGDDAVVDNMQLYLLLRKLLRARNVDRENEYRRHVTMKTVVEGREEIVNIDIITNYYLYQREFIVHVRSIVEGHVTPELRDQESGYPAEPEWMEEKIEMQQEEQRPVRHVPTPPVRTPLKVRPVSAPPRKRAPRPKKYKIQIPKGKNPIMRPPFEHDPRYNRELREAIAKKEAEKIAAAKKAERIAARKAAPKRPAPKKATARKTGKPVKKAPKKALKKKAAAKKKR